MFMEIKTTITTKIKITDDGIEDISHSVQVDGGEFTRAAGTDATALVVAGALRSAMAGLEEDGFTSVYSEESD